MSGAHVLLGVPEDRVLIPAEAGVTKIGGIPRWILPEPPELKTYRCKKCNSPLGLLLSADCPITDNYDRVLFLFICPKCGQDAKIWRQKVKSAPSDENPIAPKEPQQQAPSNDQSSVLSAIASFEVGKKSQQPTKKGKKNQPQPEIGAFPGYYIETFEEPEASLDPSMKVEVGSVDSNEGIGGGEEDKVDIDPTLIEFNERMSRCPAQVIRYSWGDQPLLQDTMQVSAPPCPHCGAPRCFELEVIPTIIYTLDHSSEMDFGPILVYSCSNDCGEGTLEEHCIICPP